VRIAVTSQWVDIDEFPESIDDALRRKGHKITQLAPSPSWPKGDLPKARLCAGWV
jgi:hypothetical protein